MKYRKKPIVIDAIQYTGELAPIMEFMGDKKGNNKYFSCNKTGGIAIQDLEGVMMVFINDYVIKDIEGKFYPCKSDVFELSYKKDDS